MGIHLAPRPRTATPRWPTFSIDPAALGHGRWVRRVLVVAALALVGVGLLFSSTKPTDPNPATTPGAALPAELRDHDRSFTPPANPPPVAP